MRSHVDKEDRKLVPDLTCDRNLGASNQLFMANGRNPKLCE